MPDNDLKTRGRARLAEIRTKLDEITAGAMKTDNGGIVLPDAAAAEFKGFLKESSDIRQTIGFVSEAEQLGKFLDTPANDDTAVRAAAAQLGVQGGEFKSIGELFVNSDAFKDRDRDGNMRGDFEVKGDLGGLYRSSRPADGGDGGMERKDIYTGLAGTQSHFTFGSVEREPMVMRPMRTQRFRDLFPVASTTANLIQYVRTMGYLGGINAARPVPEREGTAPNLVFGLKPHTNLDFQPAESPIRTIAHWEAAHRTVLADEPQLRSIIDNELLYGLRLAEDDQLLNGDGTGENVLGLLNVPGLQRYPGTGPTPVQAGDTYLDAIRRAATRVYLANYEPTGIVVHPFDWEQMELTKDANGAYLASVSVQVGADQRLWRLPVTATQAMRQGTALVGAMGLGAKIYDREQSNIRVADQHADFFLRNAIVILAEERVGLVVSRPESFVVVNLPTSTAPFA
ncbi:MAG: phage major capsid protein [Pseudonocardia sp.]|nr:phage major capsid protein [Pseudonocardia sp.]